MTEPAKPIGLWRRAKRWLARLLLAIGGFILIYAGFLVLGFVPINRGYQPPPADDRVRLFVRSNEVHTDLVMPVECDDPGIDWRELFPPKHFHSDVSQDKYVAVGWGDRAFFIDTPTWADLKIYTVIDALFLPSAGVLHVEYVGDPAPTPDLREVYVSRAQYRDLAKFVRASVGEVDERGVAKIASERTYGDWDRFYLATGRYHLFNTCNQWTGRGLASAGVPTGIWTPLNTHVLYWLPAAAD